MLNQQTKQSDQGRESGTIHRIGKWVRMLGVPMVIALGLQGAVVQAQTVYFHNDTSGSPVAATDESGNLLWQESYRPYGERMLKPSAANTQWFHGKQLDPDTGMQDFGARNYDPVLGRFMSIDPVEFSDRNIHSFNRYAYGNNNPLKYKDPDGRIAETPWDAFNVAMGFVSLTANLATGNLVGAAVDVVGIAIDATATAIPGMPGGAATAINAARVAERATEAAATLTKTGEVTIGAANGARAGKAHTPAANRLGRENNRAANDGSLVCPKCDKNMNDPVQSKSGVKVDRDAAVGDHKHPKSQGGDGATVKDMRNHETICWQCNADKTDSID